MKKCPRCLKYDNDSTRFCKHCGTELFFPERFETKESESRSASINYKNRSTVYDLLDVVYFKRKESSPRTALVNAIPALPVKVLDVCAGTCSNSILIAENKPKAKITALDRAESMLKIAEKKFYDRGIKNIEVKVVDACNTGFPAHSFDVILLSLILHEISEDLQIIIMREARRLLAPNGEIIVIEWEQPKKTFQRLKFVLIKLIEPKGFKAFLKMNLTDYFETLGFTVFEKRQCDYTRVYRLSIPKVR